MSASKPLKVRGVLRPGRIGIVAKTLKEALMKGCDKLQIPCDGMQLCLEDDGTRISDEAYFQTLASNTCLVLVEPGQDWQGGFDKVKRNIRETLTVLSQMNSSNEIQEYFAEEPSTTHELLAEFVQLRGGNVNAEGRNEHPEWFEGMDQRFKTKSQVMFVKAQERVRGYFSKTKEALEQEATQFTKTSLDQRAWVVKALKDGLKKKEFHGVYFKRSDHKHQDCLCSRDGWFSCQGAYDSLGCPHYHFINPYLNKQSMILFSSWNLDHVIEKSRSVLPDLVAAIRRCPPNKEVNVQYFYELLFTRKNLKLVHICCHKKGAHTGKVDKKRIYRKRQSQWS